MDDVSTPVVPKAHRSPLRSLATWKDVFQLVREGVVILIVGLLLLAPGCVRSSLVAAGFTRASFAGLELNLVAQAEETAAALETVETVRAETDSALQTLAEVVESSSDPEVRRQVGEVQQQLASSAAAAASADARLGRQLEAQHDAIGAVPLARPDRAAAQRIDSVVSIRRIRSRPLAPID